MALPYNKREISSIDFCGILFFFRNPLSALRLAFACRWGRSVLPSGLRMKLQDGTPRLTANEQAIATIKALMEWRHMTQADLAGLLHRSQPWLSKRLTGTTPFQIEDLDAFGAVFGLSPAELLQPGHGNLDRRCAADRRCHTERRQNRTSASEPPSSH